MAVLKRSLVLLYSLKQSYSVIRAHFFIWNVFFFFLFCVAELIHTRWLDTTEQLTSSVQRSGEMQGLSSFLLKAGFEGEIVQRSVSFFVDVLDTKEGEEL